MRNLSLGWLSSLDGPAGRCLCGCVHRCVECDNGRGRRGWSSNGFVWKHVHT